MAGVLPGVEMPSRRKMRQRRQTHHDFSSHSGLLIRGTSQTQSLIGTMDETALRARQRLEQKLGSLHFSRASSKVQPDGVEHCDHVPCAKRDRLGFKLLGKALQIQNHGYKAHKNACGVCL